MKKLKLFTAASGLLVASSVLGELKVPSVGLDAKIGFDTVNISSGRRLGEKTFTPGVTFNVPVSESFKIYAGVEAILAANGTKVADGGNETDLSVGVKYELNDIFTFDVGYICECNDKKPLLRDQAGNLYINDRAFGEAQRNLIVHAHDRVEHDLATDSPAADRIRVLNDVNGEIAKIIEDQNFAAKGKKVNHVLNIGVLADYIVNSELRAKFDTTQRKFSIIGKVGYTFDLASVGISGLAIDVGVKLGYVRATRPYGMKNFKDLISLSVPNVDTGLLDLEHFDNDGHVISDPSSSETKKFTKKGWTFVGLNVDLVYSINEYAKVRAGVGFVHNTASKNSWINAVNQKKHNVWFSTAAEFSF